MMTPDLIQPFLDAEAEYSSNGQKVSKFWTKNMTKVTICHYTKLGQYTMGELTLNFPTFSKPIPNLDFYINADQGST